MPESVADQAIIGEREALPPGGKPKGGTLTGDIRSHRVSSERLQDKRKILVYLPPGYESNPEKRYPVLYVQDGQSIFDERTATRKSEWGLDETAESLISQGKMAETIIVAVDNGGSGESRRVDFTPAPDSRYGGGQADNYLGFLRDELKPMVDATYRTQPQRETTGVMGASLGGLFSLYAGLAAPATFGLVGALSPSLWYAGQDMLKRLDAPSEGRQKLEKIWIDMGTEEANPDWSLQPITEFRQARTALQAQGYQENVTLFAPEYEGAQHTNQAWRERSGDVLQALFPPRQ